MQHLYRRFLLSLLVLIAGVCVVRAVELARFGWRPTAPGERRWYGWASGNPWERAVLESLPERPLLAGVTAEDREVALRIRAGGSVRADWVQVRAQYRWPGLRVVEVTVEGQGRSGSRSRASEPAELTVAVPALPVRTRPTGIPRFPLASWGFGALALALLARSVLRRGVRTGDRADPAAQMADAVLVLAAFLFVWKVAEAPLWSWDHYAIWGVKARRLAALGLSSGWLAPPAFPYAAPHYPLGWPALLWLVSWGRIPGQVLFKTVHGVAGLTLAWLLRRAIRKGDGGLLAASVCAALVVVSPLFWDTESLGLADLPLALCAVAGWGLVLDLRNARSRTGERVRSERWPAGLRVAGTGGGAGLLLGLLPWIKQEGWTLSVLLLVAGLLVLRPLAPGLCIAPVGNREDRLRSQAKASLLLVPCLSLWLLQPLAHSPFLSPGTSFLTGDWVGRAVSRLPMLVSIVGRMAVDLLDPAWVGLWVFFVAAVLLPLLPLAPVRRGRPGLLLAAVVMAQLAAYAAIYLSTYLDPAAHVDSSFLRIAGALAPLAAGVVGVTRPA